MQSATTTAAIAGASGLVGSRVLQRLLDRADIAHVVAVGRRPLAVHHDKLASHEIDFRDKASIAARLPPHLDVAFCCLGTTIKQAGSREAFRAVDYDAVLAYAAAAKERGAARFLIVTSMGATAQTANFYLRVKGEVENALALIAFPQLTILRPSLIDDQGSRREYRLGERIALPIARLVFAVAGRTSRYAPVSADAIAKAMVHLAFDATTEPLRVVESDRLHAVAEQSRSPS
jgi:uncharacterized protein YbjT (DUF2867 family)